jgi:hypothetical protein
VIEDFVYLLAFLVLLGILDTLFRLVRSSVRSKRLEPQRRLSEGK